MDSLFSVGCLGFTNDKVQGRKRGSQKKISPHQTNKTDLDYPVCQIY